MQKRIAAAGIRLKRAYQPPARGDGMRILVDRLWPRGIRKADAAIDHWAKTIAPSNTLRTWFGHDAGRWQEFQRRYAAELRGHPDKLAEIRGLARRGLITLVFAAHDEAHNNAVVLRGVLLGRPR